MRRFAAIGSLVVLGALFAAPVWGQGAGDAAIEFGAPRSPEILLGIFFVLLVFSGLVSGSETAIFSLDKLDLLQLRARPSRSSKSLFYLLERPNDTLTTLLVLNNVVNVGLSLTAGALAESFFSGNTVGGFALAAFLTTTLLLVFGEVVPKCIAHVKARALSRIVAWPTAAVARLLTPVRWAMNLLIQSVFRRFGIAEAPPTDRVTEGELKAMIGTREVSTLLEQDEREMIDGVFELRHTFAEEIMIPRGEVETCPDTLDQHAMLEAMRQARHSRIPIYHGDLDHLVGFVLAKEILLHSERDWRRSLRQALCVPCKVRLVDLLGRFRRASTKLAVVVDEYGGVAGVVSLRDLLEEIVGDMAERHERVEEECTVLGPGRWSVRGRMNLDDLGQRIGVDFPQDMGATAGGFVMNTLGRVARENDELVFEGRTFKVTQMIGRRIMRMEIVENAKGRALRAGEAR